MRPAGVELPFDSCRRAADSRMLAVSVRASDDDLSHDCDLLGIVRYGTNAEATDVTAPCCRVPLQVLDGPGLSCVWRGAGRTVHGTCGAVDFRSDGEMLFGTYSDQLARAGDIEQATVVAYRALFKTAFAAGCPHLYRVWNYLPEINREIGGLEVYKAFCIGRQRAFEESPIPDGQAVPAACAIGTQAPGLQMFFIAGRRPALQLSNPRQIEAYDYPPDYGPRSPVFSRAVLLQGRNRRQLHVSGTASIVGHSTRHENDIGAQLNETLRNLEALLQQVGINLAALGEQALLTVYLRHPDHLAMVRSRLRQVLSPGVACLFLQGDICRRSLLLEIEGIISVPRGAFLHAASPALGELKT